MIRAHGRQCTAWPHDLAHTTPRTQASEPPHFEHNNIRREKRRTICRAETTSAGCRASRLHRGGAWRPSGKFSRGATPKRRRRQLTRIAVGPAFCMGRYRLRAFDVSRVSCKGWHQWPWHFVIIQGQGRVPAVDSRQRLASPDAFPVLLLQMLYTSRAPPDAFSAALL